jgi:hypothetical protein
MFILKRPRATGRAEDDLLTAAFQFQRIARFQLQFLSQGLGNDDAASLVDNEAGIHNWYYNMGGPIGKCHLPGEMAFEATEYEIRRLSREARSGKWSFGADRRSASGFVRTSGDADCAAGAATGTATGAEYGGGFLGSYGSGASHIGVGI